MNDFDKLKLASDLADAIMSEIEQRGLVDEFGDNLDDEEGFDKFFDAIEGFVALKVFRKREKSGLVSEEEKKTMDMLNFLINQFKGDN